MPESKTVVAGTPLKIVSSGKWSLNARDFVRGAVLAVGSAIVQAAYELVQQPDFSFNFDRQTLTKMLTTGIIAGVVYLGKNFATDAKVVAVDSEAK